MAGELDAILECDDIEGLEVALAAFPVFSDNCDATTASVVIDSINTQGDDPDLCSYYSYTITRYWTATDECGNTSASYSQVITIQDTQEPVVDQASGALNMTLDCHDSDGINSALALSPTYTDNCDDDVPAMWHNTSSSKGLNPELCTYYNYTITQVWSAKDACNNTSPLYFQVITVQDTTDPVAEQIPTELDAIVDCNDPQALEDALAMAPTFDDNCDPTAPAVLQSSMSTQDMDEEACENNSYTITRTWTGTDACGNTSSVYTQVITVQDISAPVANEASDALDVMLECDDMQGLADALADAPTFDDNCDPTAEAVEGEPVNTQDPNEENCGHYNYTITRTWTSTDACGNTSSVFTQVITVQDTEVPVADQAPNALDVTLDCHNDAGLTAALANAPTFTDNCDPTAPAILDITDNTQDPNMENCGHYSYTITRTWKAMDACGNISDVFTQVISVQDTTDPVANEMPAELDALVNCDDEDDLTAALAMAPTFDDNCDPTAPAEMTGSESTQGDDPEECDYYNYTITRTWTASDACGNISATYTQVITVQDIEDPLADQNAGDLDDVVQCDDPEALALALTLAPTFSDNCDPTTPTVLTDLVNTRGIDPEACSYYNYTITRTWTGTDACGNTSEVYTQVITVEDTEDPLADQMAGDLDEIVECDNSEGLALALALKPTFTDNCDPTAPTVLVDSVNTKGNDPELCTYHNYTITRTWTGTDACGNTSAVYTQVITVQDTEVPLVNEASNALDELLECDDTQGLADALAATPTFDDNCDPTAPAVLQSSMSTQDPDEEDCQHYNYTITRTWNATDACGNTSATFTQVITVQDTESPLADQGPNALNVTLDCHNEAGLQAALEDAPTFTDNCDPTAPAVEGVPSSTQGQDPEECDYYNYTITRTWTAEDACGNESLIFTQIITVQDTTNPVADQEAGALSDTVLCNDPGGLEMALTFSPTFTDNCDENTPALLVSTVNTQGMNGPCSNYNYTITRTWTATDECNNTSSPYVQVITVADTTGPTMNPLPMDMAFNALPEDCQKTVPIMKPAAVDNCQPTAVVTMTTDDPNIVVFDLGTFWLADFPVGVTTVTITGTDPCGNNTYHVFTVTVIDVTPPVITGCPGNIMKNVDPGQCGAIVNWNPPTVIDNCNATVVASHTSGDFFPVGMTVVSYVATDASGNASTCSFTVTVVDNINPTISCGGNISVPAEEGMCSADVTIPLPTFGDNCPGATIMNNYNGTPNASDNYPGGVTTVIWTVTDASGRTATCAITVTVLDTQDPVVDEGIIADCYETVAEAEQAAIDATDASDNCPGMLSFMATTSETMGCDSMITVTVTDASGNSASVTYTTRINCDQLDVNVFLEGPYDSNTGLMSTWFNEYHILPGQDPMESVHILANLFGVAAPPGQPYNTAPWNYAGTEGDDFGDGAGDTEYPETVVDWLLISVREGDSSAMSEIWKCAALLHRDSEVEIPADCPCLGVSDGNDYYIVVEHRNHLPVMSTKIQSSGGDLSFDFTQNQSWIWNPGIPIGYGQKLIGSNYAMHAGNSEQAAGRNDINAADDGQWLVDFGTIIQYRKGDHDMNADVNATDEFLWIINNGFFTVIPF
jgi:hypothetical protein